MTVDGIRPSDKLLSVSCELAVHSRILCRELCYDVPVTSRGSAMLTKIKRRRKKVQFSKRIFCHKIAAWERRKS